MTNSPSKWSPTIDDRNRLDAKNPNREGLLEDKPYMKAMYEIRSKLRLALNEVPACPPVTSMGELFTKAEEVVHGNWQKFASELLGKHRAEWLKEIEGNEEYKELYDALSNDKVFEQNLRSYQLGPMEQLRSIAPEAWYQLLLAASERQLAQIWLLNHWLKQKPEELPKAISMTPDEVKLVLELGNLAKFFNMAFVKQTELADTPEGSSVTPLTGTQGAERIYEIYEHPEDEHFQVKTFGEMFRPEWSKVVEHLKRVSAKTASLVEAGKIPESYKGLPTHMNRVAEAYGSQEKDPEKLTAIWKDLDKSCKELAENGCPISIIGQACPMVAGDANKVDIELRVGIRDEETLTSEATLGAFHKRAQEIADGKASVLSDRFVIPSPQISRQLFFFGGNLALETPADTRAESTNIHYNTIMKLGKDLEPILEKLFTKESLTDDNGASVLDAGLHELGHGILSTEDSAIVERIGSTSEANILEELKAETAAFVILRDVMREKGGIDVKAQIYAKLGDIVSYILSSSSEEGGASERYYYASVAMLKELFEKGALKEENGQYSISDPNQVVDIIADMGESILAEFYENTDSNPEAVTQRVKQLREDRKDPRVAAFLKAMQTIQGS